MIRSILLLPLLMLAPSGNSAPPLTPVAPAVPAGFHQVKLNGHTFTLPEGFTIEIAAGPPLVDRPIVAALDEKGRLYVCDSSGSNDKVTEQQVKKPHRIVRLEDTHGDGRYDKAAVFVPKVMFPEGAMWLDGSLYVSAAPQILKFTDTDDDGRADKEAIWFDGKTLTGCANDLHGPYPGPDGRIYWCKGAFARQDYVLFGNKKWSTRASHIFRARPDGTEIEPVMSGGMDNPVDVVFTPGGERIFTTTFLQHPADGKRDGLIHAIYGGVYGKDHGPIHEHPWTSPLLMPVMTHLGPAAPCGLHRYESDQFGKEYANNLFCCQFNLRKVSRHTLKPSGSTFETKDDDFLVSDNHDFHPTDVMEDADGTLLVLDTGGWYKLCCPTSQLVKADVTGAIYRIRKIGMHKATDPRGLKIAWDNLSPKDLCILLSDDRPVVRGRAIAALARHGKGAAADLKSVLLSGKDAARLNAVWTACRSDDPSGLDLARLALADRNDDVRQAATHACSLRRNREALPVLVKLLKHENLHTRRAAAEGLGRIGDPLVLPAIIEALASDRNDRVLDHSLTYAMIEIGADEAVAVGLKHSSPRVRRAALAALEQMQSGKLEPKAVIANLSADDLPLRETAAWILGRHPRWGDQLVSYFREQLDQSEKRAPMSRTRLADQLSQFTSNVAIQSLLGEMLTNAKTEPVTQIILDAMSHSGLKAFPEAWLKGLTRALCSQNLSIVRKAIGVLRVSSITQAQFLALSAEYKQAPTGNSRTVWPDEMRLEFLAAAPTGVKLENHEFAFAIGKITKDQLPGIRSAAIDVFSRRTLSSEQFLALAGALKNVSPLDGPKLLTVFTRSIDERVGKALVKELMEPAMLAVIRVETVKPVLEKYPASVRDDAEKLYGQLAEARKGEREKLEKLLKEMPSSDIRRGQLVFNGAKGQCASCHKIGYVGGVVGPDLTRIGSIRNERDLLESIVFPSASFVRSYEPVKVKTADGRVFNGILKKESPDELVVTVGADKEERIARANVEEIESSSVSIMPAGFDQQLSSQEIADLIAFLKACR